jgi:hypothetical protein
MFRNPFETRDQKAERIAEATFGPQRHATEAEKKASKYLDIPGLKKATPKWDEPQDRVFSL